MDSLEHDRGQIESTGRIDESGEPVSISPPKFVSIYVTALWFGLLGGLLESAFQAYRYFYKGEILLLSRDFIWMAPLAYLLLITPLALVLYAFARRWPRWFPLAVTSFFFALYLCMSLVLLAGRLNQVSIVLLSVGLAVQAARMIARRADRFLSLVRATLTWLAVLVGVILVGTLGSRWLAEWRVLQAQPNPPENAPNVLLIVMDTVRAQSTSLRDYSRQTTPNLEELGRSGVVFDMAISTAPFTLPSHASIFTGHYPFEFSASWEEPVDAIFPTLAEVLGSQGYLTGGFSANLFYMSYEWGLDHGFAHYEDYPISLGQIVLSSSVGRFIASSDRLRSLITYHEVLNRQTATVMTKRFLRWLPHNQERPFFAFINYFDAHEPYLPPAPFDTMFGPARPPEVPFFHEYFGAERRFKHGMTPEEIQVELDAYEGSIAYVDSQIGLLIEELDARGQLENTLVIITSDHGEHFGEHQIFDHGNSLYLQELLVPLIIHFPNKVPGAMSVVEPVSLRDIPATVLHLLGLEAESPFPGETLARFWDPSRSTVDPLSRPLLAEMVVREWKPEWYPASKGDMKSVIAEETHYILNGDGTEELYDVARDPGEEHDLSVAEESEQTLSVYRQYLSEILAGPSQTASRSAGLVR